MTRVEASNELLQIPNDLEADSLDGITTSDQSWFHYLYDSLVMFAKSPCDVIPRKKWYEENYISYFFINRKLLIAKYLPKSQKYSHDYFI
jgi:hypothetical protein